MVLSDSVIFTTIGTLIGTVVGALSTGIFNLWSKSHEYKNTYFKMILDKRLDAYQLANSIIVQLKYSIQDEDLKAYHAIFLNDQEFTNFLSLTYTLPQKSLWMGNDTSARVKELFDFLVTCNMRIMKGESQLDIGKESYIILGKKRDELEKCILNDLKTLYKIDDFLANKSIKTIYENRNLYT